MSHAACTHTTPQAPAYTKASYRLEEKRKEKTTPEAEPQLNEKPSIYRAAQVLQITVENGVATLQGNKDCGACCRLEVRDEHSPSLS